MKAPLTDDEVIDRAKKFARLHKHEKTRGRMDECLAGLSEADARRVYLCGQRIAGGLTIKVIPSAVTTKEGGKDTHGNNDSKATKATARRERHPATKQGAKSAKG